MHLRNRCPPAPAPGWLRASLARAGGGRLQSQTTIRRRHFGRSRTSPESATTSRPRPSNGRSASSCWWRGRCSTPSSGSAGKPDDPEPTQVHGNTTIEIVWTVIPALILAAIAVPTVRGDLRDQCHSHRPTSSKVEVDRPPVVVGVPLSGRSTSPPPTSCTSRSGRRSSLKMSTADVVHSFWPPRFAGKRDVFPEPRDPALVQGRGGGRVSGPVRGVLRHPARADGLPGAGPDAGGVPGLGRAHADAGRQAGRAPAAACHRSAASRLAAQQPPSPPRWRPAPRRRPKRSPTAPTRGREAVH